MWVYYRVAILVWTNLINFVGVWISPDHNYYLIIFKELFVIPYIYIVLSNFTNKFWTICIFKLFLFLIIMQNSLLLHDYANIRHWWNKFNYTYMLQIWFLVFITGKDIAVYIIWDGQLECCSKTIMCFLIINTCYEGVHAWVTK